MALIEINQDDILEDVVEELGRQIDKGLDFITSEMEDVRAKAQRYYNGQSDLKSDANRSKYVATVVRDVVRAVRPSLMRVFMSSATPVEFIPPNRELAPIAAAQTEWSAQFFDQVGGYELLYGAFHDAMLKKLGVIKYWYDDKIDPIYREYTSLRQDQLMQLSQHPDIDILDVEQREVTIPGPQGFQAIPIYDVKLVGRRKDGEITAARVPLEEFIIDRNATCKKDARVIAHRRNVPKSELVQMGFTLEELEDLDGDNPNISNFSSESNARRGYTITSKKNETQDESMQEVLYTEAYYRADIDGDGIAEYYKFHLGGTDYTLLDYERVDDAPFAMFAIDPEPGTVFGKSLFDLVNNEQDAVTSLIRATIDNFHMNNNPRLAVHEHMVNMEDVLNNDLGAPIRVRSAGQIQVIDTPFTGAAALPLLQYLDSDIQSKTGVTKASAGLDPDALQSTDKDAVRNTIMQAAGQVELMARNLAESGLKDLAKGLLKLAMTHLDPAQIIMVNGQPQPIQLDAFNPKMKMRVRVGLGTGSYDERMAFLGETFAVQKEIMTTMGPGNRITSYGQMMNTIDDRARMMGVYNTGRYFNVVTPEQETQMAQKQAEQGQQAQQAAQQQANAQIEALVKAETIKAQTQAQIAQARGAVDIQKIQAQGAIDAAQLEQKDRSGRRDAIMQDDLARDKMLQDLYLAVMELQADMKQAAMIQQQQRVN